MLTKYAEVSRPERTVEVLDGFVVPANAGHKRLARMRRRAHRHHFEYSPRPGYIYVRSRAISSRCNDNFDEFPAAEIKKAYRTFIGKPVFVNHHNADHRRARGVIIDAALHEDTNPDGTEDTWAEVLMEVDAVRFPVLAREVLAGNIARTSMGTDVEYSECTACGNKAVTPADYCQHIPKMKGMKIRRPAYSPDGKVAGTEEVLIAERCYGLRFFENSLLVEDPADPTAFGWVDSVGEGVQHDEGLTRAAAKAVIDEAEGIVRQAAAGDLTTVQGLQPGDLLWYGRGWGSSVDVAVSAVGDGWVTIVGDRRTGMERTVTDEDLARGSATLSRRDERTSDDDTRRVPKAAQRTASRAEAGWGTDVARFLRGGDDPRHHCTECGSTFSWSPALHQFVCPEGHNTRPAYAARTARSGSEKHSPAWHEGFADGYAGHEFSPDPHDMQANEDYESGYEEGERLQGKSDDDRRFLGHRRPAYASLRGPAVTALLQMEAGQCTMCNPHLAGHSNILCDSHAFQAAHGTIDYPTSTMHDGETMDFGRLSSHRTAAGAPNIPADYGFVRFDSHRSRDNWERRADSSNWITLVSFSGPEITAMPQADLDAALSIGGNFAKGVTVYKRRPNLDGYMRPLNDRRASQHTAYGETKAPAKVDTMRAENCPVCGDDEGYNGDKCSVCGYMEPPSQFTDPDLTKAREQDLRQEQQGFDQQAVDAPVDEADGDLQCDQCGETFSAEGDAPTDAEAEGDVEAEQAPVDDPEDEASEEADPTDLDDVADVDDEEIFADDDGDGASEADGDEDEADEDPFAEEDLDEDEVDEISSATDPAVGEGRITAEPESSTETTLDAPVAAGSTCPVCGQGTLNPVATTVTTDGGDKEPPLNEVGTSPAKQPTARRRG